MRINNLHVAGLGIGAAPLLQDRDPSRVETAENAAAEGSGLVASAELKRWLALAAAEPEVRPEVVERAVALLNAGHYTSVASALGAAEGILRAQE